MTLKDDFWWWEKDGEEQGCCLFGLLKGLEVATLSFIHSLILQVNYSFGTRLLNFLPRLYLSGSPVRLSNCCA